LRIQAPKLIRHMMYEKADCSKKRLLASTNVWQKNMVFNIASPAFLMVRKSKSQNCWTRRAIAMHVGHSPVFST
jgi:hypothetical protein